MMNFSRIASALTLGAVALGFAGMASAATIGQTTVTGSEGEAFSADHILKRYTDTLFFPRDGAVTLSGNVDVGNANDDSAILIGLVDADLYDNSPKPDLATYQSGAYAYFSPGANHIAAPSDGNAGGGELVQNFAGLANATDIDYSLTINPDGTLDLTANGQTAMDTYGDVKIRPDVAQSGAGSDYDRPEFSNGAYLAVDFAAGGDPANSSATFTINTTPDGQDVSGGTAVPGPGNLLLMGLGLGMVALVRQRRRA